MLRFGRRHERGAEAGADETDGVGAGPDFLGDARGQAGAVERGEDAIVEPGIVRARKHDERRRGEIAELEFGARGEWVGGGEQHAVALAQEQARVQARRGRVGMKKAARERAGVERGELSGSRGFVEFDADAGEALAERAQDAGQHGGHREAGERDADVTDLAGGKRLEFGGNCGERTEERFDALEEQATGGRDLDAAAGAVEQIGGEGGLELGDGAAERGLRDRERLGGLTEMKLARDLAEIDEVAEVEGELVIAGHESFAFGFEFGVSGSELGYRDG